MDKCYVGGIRKGLALPPPTEKEEMAMQMQFCEECGQRCGSVPKHYWDGVVAMLHPDCAVRQIERYLDRKGSDD